MIDPSPPTDARGGPARVASAALVLSAAALLAWAPPAQAQTTEASDDQARGPTWRLKATEEARAARSLAASKRWFGSRVTYRNAVATRSFYRDQEPTYDPIYAMTWIVAPRLALDDTFWVAGLWQVTQELTQSNFVQRGEAMPGDIFLSVGGNGLLTVPGVGLVLSGSLGVQLPVSPFSQAQTLQGAVLPSATVSRSFGLLSGLALAYNLQAGLNLHRSTTSERDSPLLGDCARAVDCARLLNTGVRNAPVELTHTATASLGIIPELRVTAGAIVIQSFLYDAVDDPRLSEQPQEPQNTRYALGTLLTMAYTPWAPTTISVGTLAFNPQRDPDSNYYTPWFNRFTRVRLDLSVDVARLTDALLAPDTSNTTDGGSGGQSNPALAPLL